MLEWSQKLSQGNNLPVTKEIIYKLLDLLKGKETASHFFLEHWMIVIPLTRNFRLVGKLQQSLCTFLDDLWWILLIVNWLLPFLNVFDSLYCHYSFYHDLLMKDHVLCNSILYWRNEHGWTYKRITFVDNFIIEHVYVGLRLFLLQRRLERQAISKFDESLDTAFEHDMKEGLAAGLAYTFHRRFFIDHWYWSTCFVYSLFVSNYKRYSVISLEVNIL